MKTANGIIRQTKRMMREARNNNARHRKIAEIGCAYLHNIARHYKMPYGLKTWSRIGNNAVSRDIYAK